MMPPLRVVRQLGRFLSLPRKGDFFAENPPGKSLKNQSPGCSIEIFESHRVFGRLTNTAIQSVLNDNGFLDSFLIGKNSQDVWDRLNMVFTYCPTAKNANAMSRPLTLPAIHFG
jgi:hypothetical protein